MNLDLMKYRRLELGEIVRAGDVWGDGLAKADDGWEVQYAGNDISHCIYRPLDNCHEDRLTNGPCVPAIPDTTCCSSDDLDAGDQVAAGVTAMFKAKYRESKSGGAGHYEANIRAMEFVQGLIGRHLWAMATAQEGK
ncbi:MAG TPA: hypothetical protein DCY07_04275 [Rhodospirillaceae bacterium]|nr:hypothetical protein [Rhodospirillaceae bacterium]